MLSRTEKKGKEDLETAQLSERDIRVLLFLSAAANQHLREGYRAN